MTISTEPGQSFAHPQAASQQNPFIQPDHPSFSPSQPAADDHGADHLLGDVNVNIQCMAPKLFPDLPDHPGFMDEVFQTADGMSPNLLGSDALRGWMQGKTPDFVNCFSDNLFQDNPATYGDHAASELNPEDISSSSSDVRSSHTSRNDHAADRGLQTPQSFVGRDSSEWQAGLINDDIGHFLQRSSSGHINYMGKRPYLELS